MEEVHRHAVARVAELLRHPDDLNFKVEVLRRKLVKEKRALETQLNTDVQRQFDEVKDGLQWLGSSHDQVDHVRRRIARMDQLCQEAKRWIPYYDRIAKISCAHRNFLDTLEFVREFQAFHRKRENVAHLVSQMETQVGSFDINLLRVHYELHHLEQLRDKSMTYTAHGDPDVVLSLERMFDDIAHLSQRFERCMWSLVPSFFELAEHDRSDLIVQLLKVVEFEEQQDRNQEEEERMMQSKAASHDAAQARRRSHYPRPEEMLWNRQLHRYKETLFEQIDHLIHHRLHAVLGVVQPSTSSDPNGSVPGMTPEAMDEALASFGELTETVIHDLAVVQNFIAPCFPPNYDIFAFFVKRYHRTIYDRVKQLVTGEMDGGIILDLLRVSQEYNVSICQSLGIPQDWLEPRLLEGREDALVQEYMAIVRKKLREWVENLMKTETAEFANRSKPPELDADNLYCLEASVILFQIVNEQVELACGCNRGRIVYDVVGECHTVFRQTQQQWRRVVDAEYRRQLAQASDVPPGLVDYIIALGNDQLRSVEYTETVLQRVCDVVNRSYQEKLQNELSTAMEGFMDLANLCCDSLCKLVFNDIQSVFQQLFTPAWYKDDIMQAVVLTLTDYCEDFKSHLHSYLLSRILKSVLERYAISYLDAVRNKHAKFTRPASVERFRADVDAAHKFFVQFLEPEFVQEWLQPLYATCGLIESSPTLIFLDFYAMKKQYPDLPLTFIKDILQKRDDIDKSQVKEIMESLRSKMNNEAASLQSKQTIFSQLNNY
ncbi:SNARE-binding exocyst subunit S6 [Dimargaris xerosporica]|nr:SNARE-binding exocyst subunit S6 [Dimargaris xerosporica]